MPLALCRVIAARLLSAHPCNGSFTTGGQFMAAREQSSLPHARQSPQKPNDIMLKITRTARPDAGLKNAIDIADGLIKIRIDRVQGNQVHVSIEAPRDIKIMRAELLHASPSAPNHKALRNEVS